MTTLEILIAARALIADPARWCQGASGRDANGGSAYGFGFSAACRWSAVGAILKTTCNNPELFESAWVAANTASIELFEGMHIIDVNDEIGHAAVLHVYDFVIRGMEEAE